MGERSLYDRIGAGYPTTRRPDPRIARAIHGALADARRVVNVGAGTGSYEPRECEVVAVEPSEVMMAQRPPDAAPVRASAEALPFEDGSFDAAMAVLSDHHWSFARLDSAEVEDTVARLRADLDSGAWHERNAELLGCDELDCGFRLIAAEYG